MRVIGLAMVKNEEDVIEHVVRHMLAQVDLVVVADNLSTDTTREILDGITNSRLVVLDDLDPAYHQSVKMTALANEWADPGDWVVPFDADELWSAPDDTRLGDWLLTYDAPVAAGRPWTHVPQYGPGRVDCPFEAMPHRVLTQEVWPKAALRWAPDTVIEQGNHWTTSAVPDVLDIRHFQYRTLQQFSRKVIQGTHAMELTDLPADSCAHWRRFAAMSDAELAAWWQDYVNQELVLDVPYCRACNA